MSDDPVFRFYNATPEERVALLADPAVADPLSEYWGEAAFAEISGLVGRTSTARHLAADDASVVFVPGIMGSLLTSGTLGGVWWIDVRHLKHVDRLGLGPTGRQDAEEDAEISSFASDLSYEPFLTASREERGLTARPFHYDWRKSLTASAGRLRDRIRQVYEAYGSRRDRPVHLVAHSMGGLLIRATLRLHGDEIWPMIGKVVFVGTPHHGAPVIAGYVENHLWGFDALAFLGAFLSRPTFRSLWGVLELLPAPAGVYPGSEASDHPAADFDLYDAGAWRIELSDEERGRFQTALDGARAFHEENAEAHRRLDQRYKDRMLMIAGVGYKTVFRVEKGWFGRARTVTRRRQCEAHREGDGRVPLASAELPGVETRYVRGVHGGLPNIPAVSRDVFAFLGGEDLRLATTCAGAFQAHLAGEETVSAAPLLDGTDRAREAAEPDDPGLFDDEPREDAWRDEQAARYERGEIPFETLRDMALDRIKIL